MWVSDVWVGWCVDADEGDDVSACGEFEYCTDSGAAGGLVG